MHASEKIQAVFFDLDGTLLDTAPDIAKATNHVLAHHGLQSKPPEEIRPYIGGGITGILTNIFNINQNHNNYPLLRQQILQAYQQLMLQETQLFPGMSEVISLLTARKIPWGIITSKPTWLAKPIVDHIQHLCSHHILIGRETLPFSKPHPLPLNYAARQVEQIAHQHCVYIGDAKTDIIAAKAAGMQSIAANYGYILPEDNPKSWNADYIIETPYDLIAWLKPRLSNFPLKDLT